MQGFLSPGVALNASPAKPFLDGEAVVEARSEIVRAIQAQRERGLLESVKWLSELLVGLKTSTVTTASTRAARSSSAAAASAVDDDTFHLGKAYFDTREFLRAYHVLKDARDAKSHFLASYSLYLAGEMRRQEDSESASFAASTSAPNAATPAGGPPLVASKREEVVNPFLADLSSRLRVATCPYSSWLRGVVAAQLGASDVALSSLVAAVRAEPLLWCAWCDLCKFLCGEKHRDSVAGVDMRLAGLDVSQHWMYRFFYARLKGELQHFSQCAAALDEVLATCPSSMFGRTEKALMLYHMRDFEASQAVFEDMWREDPYRISDMDVYSNILYVRQDRAKLSYLAHRVTKTDRYRQESCCIVGNYYSLRGNHAKAVSYFQRALRLNPLYLSAWTLMGHECMEMSNAVAAVNCYRRAVDINERDFRAWYALGQAYEILGMDGYAMWYFHKACALRPHDSRMWVALASCLEKMGRSAEAIRSYERAVQAGDPEQLALRQLARLHDRDRNPDRAAYCFKAVLDALDAKHAETPATVEALLYLAKHCMNKGFWKEAEKYCFRLLDFNAPEKEEAKSLLKTIHTRTQAQPSQVPAFGSTQGKSDLGF